MPVYGTATNVPATYPGNDGYLVWNAEKPASATLSQQVCLGQPYMYSGARAVSMEVSFPSNPGTFNFNLATADTDTLDAYVNETGGSITTATQGTNGFYYARLEINVKARFAAVRCVTANSNSVAATVKLS